MQDRKWDEMTPENVTVYQKGEQKYTNPDQIPNPREVASILRNIKNRSKNFTSLRNTAFYTTLWDTGARVGALIRVQKNDVTVKKETVEIELPGIKDSDDRSIECFFAAPVLKRWIENHPDQESEYLFCQLNGENRGDMMSYRHINSLIKEAYQELETDEVIDVEWKGQPLHVFRKSMKTWFDNMDLMGETDLDIRAGHKHGSEATRRYTRKSDDDANRALREGLGLDEETDEDWKGYMWPVNCPSCDTVNSGFNARCFSCGTVLDEDAYPRKVSTETEDPLENVDKEELSEALEKLENAKKQGLI